MNFSYVLYLMMLIVNVAGVFLLMTTANRHRADFAHLPLPAPTIRKIMAGELLGFGFLLVWLGDNGLYFGLVWFLLLSVACAVVYGWVNLKNRLQK